LCFMGVSALFPAFFMGQIRPSIIGTIASQAQEIVACRG
jgi:hypothetical protein